MSLKSSQRISQKVTRSCSLTPWDPLIIVSGATRIQRKPVSRSKLSLDKQRDKYCCEVKETIRNTIALLTKTKDSEMSNLTTGSRGTLGPPTMKKKSPVREGKPQQQSGRGKETLDTSAHLVHGQVQGIKAKKHNAVSESLHQRGAEAQRRPHETQQLHRSVCVQAQMRSQPQQGGRGQQLFPQRFTAVSQLPASRQQPLITVET